MNRTVFMPHMRPGELDEAIKECPIAYIPFGVIEWHGPHLPLGTDSFEIESIVRNAAEKYGGVVFPTTWFHAHFQSMQNVLFELLLRLKKTGFRVLVIASAHHDSRWQARAEQALSHALEYEPFAAGFVSRPLGEFEINGVKGEDHACYYETSHMLYLQPADVDLSKLDEAVMVMDMKKPLGIGGGRSPLEGTPETGKLFIDKAGDYLGSRALEQLRGLPKDKQGMSLPEIAPEHWWFV